MDPLQALLARKLAEGAPAPLCVALSGGGDSTALLHALARLPQARERGLRALHVDHGLHVDSAKWAEHCRRFCGGLGVPIEVVRVEVDRGWHEGLEAAARKARYRVFSQSQQGDELLVLAHHRDDQTETVLLKLLRGAGPEGLGAMQPIRIHSAVLWRPLLDVPRAELREYVSAHRLDFIHDPSNDDTSLSRNYLRMEIIPKLMAHWPQAHQSITNSADLCRAAAAFIGKSAREVVKRWTHEHPHWMDAQEWLDLPEALRAQVLERWLRRDREFTPPTRAQCREVERQILQNHDGRVPLITWPNVEVRLWRGRIYAERPGPSWVVVPEDWSATWNGDLLVLPVPLGWLDTSTPSGHRARFDPPLAVRFRRGGERIKPAGDKHTRELRDLFQRAGIPPWQRAHVPLIFSGQELIAIGTLWISETGKRILGENDAKLEWSGSAWYATMASADKATD